MIDSIKEDNTRLVTMNDGPYMICANGHCRTMATAPAIFGGWQNCRSQALRRLKKPFKE